MRGTWRSETTLREHKNGGPAWTRRLWRPVLYQLSYGPRNCGASSKPNRTVSPPGACSSRRRRAAAHVERDGHRPDVEQLDQHGRRVVVGADMDLARDRACRADRGTGRATVF